MSQYDDLLKQLQSDEPFRPAQVKKADKVTHHAYELESATLRRDSYTSKDLEGFIGFIVSFMASSIIHTSTPLAAKIAEGDLLEQRYDTYEKRAAESGNPVGDGTEELVQTLSNLCASAINKIVNDPDVKLGINDTFELTKFASIITSVFAMGRSFKDIEEDKLPDVPNMLTGIILACYKRVPKIEELDIGDELQKIINLQLEALELMDVTAMVKDPEAWVKAFKEANQNV